MHAMMQWLLLKPRAGKSLRDKKVRTAQAAYQKEQLGDAFIENEALMAAVASVPLNFPKPERRRTMSRLKPSNWKPNTPLKIHLVDRSEKPNPVPPTENR